MNTYITISQIKSDYDELEYKIVERKIDFSESEVSNLVENINSILGGIEEYSKNIKEITFDDHSQLSKTTLKLQSFLSNFGKARTVELSQPDKWLPSASKSFSEEEIKNLLNHQAALIAYAREQQKPNDRADENWHIAEIYFASEVLDGRINFASRIASESYIRLENIWLKDVKLLQAYYRSIKRGKTNNSFHIEDYFEVCKHIREELLTGSIIKGHSNEFTEAEDYLQKHYVEKINNKYQLKPIIRDSENKLYNLINYKAKRISEVDTTENRTDKDDWYNAETYVKMFYENIIPAVLEKNEEKTLRVLKSFQYSKTNRFFMINCFETALAIYFLDTKVIKKLWEKAEKIEKFWKKYEKEIISILDNDQNDQLELENVELENTEIDGIEVELVPDSTVKSSIKSEILWPENKNFISQIEERQYCKKRFWISHDRTKIGFDGVMLNVERKALLAAVDKYLNEINDLKNKEKYKKYKQAINELYVQSRIIHKETTL